MISKGISFKPNWQYLISGIAGAASPPHLCLVKHYTMPHRYFVGQISRLALSFPGFEKAWIKAADNAEKQDKMLVIFEIPAAAEMELVAQIENLLDQVKGNP